MNVSMSKLYRNGLPSKIFGFAFHRRMCPQGRSSLARILQEAEASITAFSSQGFGNEQKSCESTRR